GRLPSVTVRRVDGKAISPNYPEILPNFEGRRKDVEGSEVKGMSFDITGHILIVGFENKPFLLAFPLTAERPEPKWYHYPASVLEWSHSVDNRLAVVTEMQVFIENLTEISDKTAIWRPLPKTASVLSVALSPKGTILATGDAEGVVTIRLSYGGEQVLQLAHEGSILKLGFSPNGRVLA